MHGALLALQLSVVVSASSTTIDPAIVQAATREAARIWRPHVAIDFTSSRENGTPDLYVVITDLEFRGAAGESSGIGQIRFSAPHQPVNTVYLSVPAVRRLAGEARWKDVSLQQLPSGIRSTFMANALGRALAHELGHFLLRSTAHTSRGLMRAAYATPELMDDSVQPYTLTRTQVAEIRRTTSALTARREP